MCFVDPRPSMKHRRSRVHKTHCFPEVSVNKCFIIYFFAVRYPCFLANQIASFAVRYFTIRTAQPDRCGLQITITKKFKIKYVLKAKNTLTMLKIEK